MNFPFNSPVFEIFLQIKFSFSYLGLNPIACWFLVNNLHFITNFTHRGQSPVRWQPIKEPSLKYYPFFLCIVSTTIRDCNIYFLVRVYWRQQFQFTFNCKSAWNYILEVINFDFLSVRGTISIVPFATLTWPCHASCSLSNGE